MSFFPSSLKQNIGYGIMMANLYLSTEKIPMRTTGFAICGLHSGIHAQGFCYYFTYFKAL